MGVGEQALEQRNRMESHRGLPATWAQEKEAWRKNGGSECHLGEESIGKGLGSPSSSVIASQVLYSAYNSPAEVSNRFLLESVFRASARAEQQGSGRAWLMNHKRLGRLPQRVFGNS